MKLFDAVGRILFPPKCLLCGKILGPEETDLCHACRVDVPDCPVSDSKLPFLDSWVAVWRYEGNVRKSLLRFKFHGTRSYAKGYGRMLAMKIQTEHPEGFDLLTWVPTGTLRQLRRGYDQAQLLANAVGAELGMEPVALLRKVRNNPPQSGFSGYAERKANVLGAYRLKENVNVADRKILLLDDIITTGATAGEAARVLLTAGAKEVHCGAVASARHQAKTSG